MMPAFALSNPGIKLYRLSRSRARSRVGCANRSSFGATWRRKAGTTRRRSLFWDADRLASEIVIRRTAEQGDFTAREMALLQRLHPHLETTLQRLSAVRAACGVVPVQCCRRTRLAKHDAIAALPGELTVAERELVQFVRIGFSNKEIAARLDKSVRTVKTQLTSVYKKCGVRSRSRLLAMMMPRLSYD